LNQLRYHCASHKKENEYQVWQEGFHPQSIPTDEIMLQKLEYLHNNPVKRGLVASPEHWAIFIRARVAARSDTIARMR
jgi:putative transposase